jgi:hypothetical protein
MSQDQIEITFEYSRYVGPRYIRGGVTLQFDSSQPYTFTSHAHWPVESYESAVRAEVEQVLREKFGNLERVKVVLTRIMWDDVASNEMGFRRAARAAAEAAFPDGPQRPPQDLAVLK